MRTQLHMQWGEKRFLDFLWHSNTEKIKKYSLYEQWAERLLTGKSVYREIKNLKIP